ncbi:MAG TPA: histidine--tRNA ligase [Chloroflexota bacterium]|nr:histidine--tRNA ligase [Chloroflexota bacterium]
MTRFSTPRGTQDILPDDWPHLDFIVDSAFAVASLFGYRRIETPAFAEASLFARATGEGTDIADKEMYVFRDRDGVEMALRPEGTAPVVRAYLEHGMHKLSQPVKLCYVERMYRYDKPQRGRYREHRQFGCEAIGSADAFVDVEMISLLDTFFRRIGLTDLSLHVNSIGDGVCRPAYVAALVAYLRRHADGLSAQDRDRIGRNPLRVLDSKDPESQETIEGAPHSLDYLCEDCAAHWEKLRRGLETLGIPYTVDFRLVRGLDYYTRTVFEFMPERDGRQAVVAAGGRYDALSESIGGPRVPGIGFGSGLERLLLNLKERGFEVTGFVMPKVYVVHAGPGTEDRALAVVAAVRNAGMTAEMSFGERSLKAQLRQAGGQAAEFAAIIGEDELARGVVTLRSLAQRIQRQVPLDDLVRALRESS